MIQAIRSIKEDPVFREGFNGSPETIAKTVRLFVLCLIPLLAIYQSFFQKTDRNALGEMTHFTLGIAGNSVVPLILYGDNPPMGELAQIIGSFAGTWVAVTNFQKDNILLRIAVGVQAGSGIAAIVSSISHNTRRLGSWVGSFDTIRNTMGTLAYLKSKVM